MEKRTPKTQVPLLNQSVELILDVLPAVWGRIRSTLRAAGTSRLVITLEQFHVLRHIGAGCASVAELAEKRQVSPSAISQAVNVLVAKGLVTRTESSGDRRCTVLALTPLARKVLDDNRKETRAWMAERMSGLSEAELATVIQAMQTLEQVFVHGEMQ